jgi:hypothetical protein
MGFLADACRQVVPVPKLLVTRAGSDGRRNTSSNRFTESRTPNWHRAKSPTQECGWKGGDRGGLVERTNGKKQRDSRSPLTGTGLLMEGVDVRRQLSGDESCKLATI